VQVCHDWLIEMTHGVKIDYKTVDKL